jgi:hypothetical protein
MEYPFWHGLCGLCYFLVLIMCPFLLLHYYKFFFLMLLVPSNWGYTRSFESLQH